ncbi:MAG: ATP-binding cassette domain-containing protein [Candidatus Electrothrix sp. AS4_5]|nr:ATP-binding cassette domain-containing protein [Candidatus Electrothrix gigas]
MITVERLTYEYPETKALDDISFTVQEGAITALVGPNGAGKTTLLKCIAGLVKPYSGSISVHGINVLEEPRKSHEIMGFLTDFFGLINKGIPVVEFFIKTAGMQEQYLETMRI